MLFSLLGLLFVWSTYNFVKTTSFTETIVKNSNGIPIGNPEKDTVKVRATIFNYILFKLKLRYSSACSFPRKLEVLV